MVSGSSVTALEARYAGPDASRALLVAVWYEPVPDGLVVLAG
jgi:hypothetical protein